MLPTIVLSQEYNADRPGVSNSPYIVGHHNIAFESGIGYSKGAYSNQTLFRYGALKNLEMRTELDFYHATSNRVTYSGLNNIIIGLKVPIFQGKKKIPDIAILGNLTLPKTGTPTPSFALLLQKKCDDISFGCNAGIFWDNTTYAGPIINPYSTGKYAQGFYSFIIEYDILKSSVFVEAYGFYSKQLVPYRGLNIGVTYMITPELQVDLCYGNDIEMNNSLISGGIAWRLPKH